MDFKQRWMPIDFYKTMEILSKTFRDEKKMKVKITEKQIGILEYCAFLGIEDFHQLSEITKIKHPCKSKEY